MEAGPSASGLLGPVFFLATSWPSTTRGTYIFRDENCWKIFQSFSNFTCEYENESKNGKAGHENEHELTKYREFRKRTNSSGFMSNTVDIRKLNTEYRPIDQVYD